MTTSPRRPIGRLRRLFALLVWAGALACVAFLVVTQSEWGRDRIREEVVRALRAELGIDPRIGDLRLELRVFPPAAVVVANDVDLIDPVYGSLARVRRLAVRPSLGRLLVGRVDLRSIELDAPAIRLLVEDGQIRNVPRLRASEGGGEVSFDELRVRRGSVTVITDLDVEGVLDGIDLDLSRGDDGELALQLDARGGHVRVQDVEEPIERFVVSGTVASDDGVSIDQAVLRTPSARLELTDAEVPLPWREAAAGTVRARLDLGALARLPEDLGLPALDGELEVDLDVSAQGDAPFAEGRVRVHDGSIAERYGLGDHVDLHVTADREAVVVHRDSFIDLEGERAGRVGVSGRIGLAMPFPTELALAVDELELGRLMGQLGVTPDAIVEWFLSAEIELAGSLAPFSLRGPIHARTHDFLVTSGPWHARPRERIVGVRAGRIDGEVDLDAEFLRFRRLALDTGRTRGEVDVDIGFGPTFRVSARLETIDLADVSPLVDYPLEGVGAVDLLVEGLYDDPSLGGHATVRGFAFDGMRFGDVETDYRMEEGGMALRFPDVSATRGESRYHVRDLFLDFRRRRFEATASVALDRLDLDEAYRVFGLDQDERFASYAGSVRGDVAVRYTSGFPDDAPSGTLTLGLDLALPSFSVDGVAFADGTLEGTWRWLDYDRGVEGAVLELDHLALHKGEGTLAVSGRMDLGGVLAMTFAADRIPLEQTEGVGDAIPALTGHYALLGTVSGTYEVPRVEADLDLANLAFAGEPLGGARAYVRLTDKDDPWVRRIVDEGEDAPCRRARLGLLHGTWRPDPPLRTAEGPVPARVKPMAFLVCGEGLDGQVALDLALGWTSRWPARGAIALRGLDLAPFAPHVDGADAIEGRVSGEVAFDDGELLAPDTLSGTARLAELTLSTSGVALANAGDIRLRMHGGTLEILEAVMMGDGTLLELGGRGSLRHGLDYSLEGFADLGLLSTVTPLVADAGGRLALEVRLRGPAADPAIYGRATVRGAHLDLRDVPVPVRELEGDVAFSARRVLFERFHARVGTAEARLEGAATLEGGGVGSYHADIRLEDFLHRPEPELEVDLDAQTRLEWRRGMRLPLLRGRVILDRVRYAREVNLSPTLGELYRPQREEVDRYDPAQDALELDLEVVQRAPARVVNNLVDMDVVVEDRERPFRVVGTDQRVGAIGSLRIPRGALRFRNAVLDIRDGRIELDDPERVNPAFDVTATTEIQRREDVGAPDWRLTLRAHGDLDGFELDATSTPELPQQDVMLLLTLGMTTSEAQQLAAQDLGTVGLEALSAVSGVESEVREAFRMIDEIELTTTYHPATNRPEPQVTIGKRIAGRVRLTASTGLTAETRAIQARAEWRVSGQTRLQAAYDNINRESSSSFGNLGVDLRWRLEFE